MLSLKVSVYTLLVLDRTGSVDKRSIRDRALVRYRLINSKGFYSVCQPI